MLSDALLDEYAAREATKGTEVAPQLLTLDHRIADPLELYPEYRAFDLKDAEIGLHRPGVNIGLLLFFYPRIIAYVPPLTPEQFEQRYGMDLDGFLALADPGLGTRRFIFPILGHPRHYQHPEVRAFLEPLLRQQPPTWDRWHVALRVSGGDRWFAVAEQHLRLDTLRTDTAFLEKWVANRRTVNSIDAAREEIAQQAKNRFVDLCLIGLDDEAIRLARTGTTSEWFATLDYSSEVFAYPHVIGAGGSFNYVTKNADAYVEMLRQLRSDPATRRIIDEETLRVLLEGFQFNKVPRMLWVEYLLHYHRSDFARSVRDAYHRLLRIARRSSGKVSFEELASEVRLIAGALRDFCESAEANEKFKGRIAKERQTVYSLMCAVGSVLASLYGLVTPQIPHLSFISGIGFTGLSLLTPGSEAEVQKRFIARHFDYLEPELKTSQDDLLTLFQHADRLAADKRKKVLEFVDRGEIAHPVPSPTQSAIQHLWVPVSATDAPK